MRTSSPFMTSSPLMRQSIHWVTLTTACLLLGLVCGGTDSGADQASPGDIYVAGMEKVSESQAVIVQLKESRPAPLYIGLHSWTLSVRSTIDEPITNAVVKAEPLMVAHGHGTQPRYTIARESESTAGEYVLLDLDLFMPGIWNVIITIETSDGLADSVEFAFDLGVRD